MRRLRIKRIRRESERYFGPLDQLFGAEFVTESIPTATRYFWRRALAKRKAKRGWRPGR